MELQLEYGAVKIVRGDLKGRIGNYDDEEGNKAIVYVGSILLNAGCFILPFSHLQSANTNDLIRRRDEINHFLNPWTHDHLSYEDKYSLLVEKSWIDGILYDNIVELWFGKDRALKGRRVFLSHSSRDKHLINRIATDLANVGMAPWLDSWEITAGESIPQKIGQGITECSHVVVFLSKDAIKSQWVEREWHAKYWDEIERSEILVIPALLEDCEIPALLKPKKYADFRRDYQDGLTEMLRSFSQVRLKRKPTSRKRKD